MGEIKIGRMVLGTCGTNCYFLYREDTKDAIFVDPADNGKQIFNALKDKGFTIKGILLTHGHFDHILGGDELRKLTGAKIYALNTEKEICEGAKKNLSEWAGGEFTIIPDEYISDGSKHTIADITFSVIATPGHTIGSCCFYFEEANMLISGDTLFEESVGRTDFATGDMSTLIRSIKDKLFVLPNETKVYPGHGESTTIDHEKKYNPFVAE